MRVRAEIEREVGEILDGIGHVRLRRIAGGKSGDPFARHECAERAQNRDGLPFTVEFKPFCVVRKVARVRQAERHAQRLAEIILPAPLVETQRHIAPCPGGRRSFPGRAVGDGRDLHKPDCHFFGVIGGTAVIGDFHRQRRAGDGAERLSDESPGKGGREIRLPEVEQPDVFRRAVTEPVGHDDLVARRDGSGSADVRRRMIGMRRGVVIAPDLRDPIAHGRTRLDEPVAPRENIAPLADLRPEERLEEYGIILLPQIRLQKDVAEGRAVAPARCPHFGDIQPERHERGDDRLRVTGVSPAVHRDVRRDLVGIVGFRLGHGARRHIVAHIAIDHLGDVRGRRGIDSISALEPQVIAGVVHRPGADVHAPDARRVLHGGQTGGVARICFTPRIGTVGGFAKQVVFPVAGVAPDPDAVVPVGVDIIAVRVAQIRHDFEVRGVVRLGEPVVREPFFGEIAVLGAQALPDPDGAHRRQHGRQGGGIVIQRGIVEGAAPLADDRRIVDVAVLELVVLTVPEQEVVA